MVDILTGGINMEEATLLGSLRLRGGWTDSGGCLIFPLLRRKRKNSAKNEDSGLLNQKDLTSVAGLPNILGFKPVPRQQHQHTARPTEPQRPKNAQQKKLRE